MQFVAWLSGMYSRIYRNFFASGGPPAALPGGPPGAPAWGLCACGAQHAVEALNNALVCTIHDQRCPFLRREVRGIGSA